MNAFPFSQSCNFCFLAFSNWQSPWGAPFIENGWNWYHAGTVAFWVHCLQSPDIVLQHNGNVSMILVFSAVHVVYAKPWSVHSSPYDSNFSCSKVRWTVCLCLQNSEMTFIFYVHSMFKSFVSFKIIMTALRQGKNVYSVPPIEFIQFRWFKLISIRLSQEESICMMHLNCEKCFFQPWSPSFQQLSSWYLWHVSPLSLLFISSAASIAGTSVHVKCCFDFWVPCLISPWCSQDQQPKKLFFDIVHFLTGTFSLSLFTMFQVTSVMW